MYYWPCMQVAIKDYVAKCQVCNVHKGVTAVPLPVLRYPTPTYPWERVSMDILGGFSMSVRGYRYLLVIVDAFTRYCELVPLRDKSAKSVANAFKERILDRHNAPSVLVTDNGTEFQNEILQELCRVYGIKKCNILTHHPASNGLSERLNRKILNTLRANVNFQNVTWDEFISDVQCTLNRSYHKTLRDTPFFALHGFDKIMPYDVMNGSPMHRVSSNDHVATKFAHTQAIHQRLSANIAKATDDFTSQANKHAKMEGLTSGMLVMETCFDSRSDTPKFDPKFAGPYRILKHLGGHKYRIKHLDSGREKDVHGDHLKQLSYDTDGELASEQSTHADTDTPLPVLNPDPVPAPVLVLTSSAPSSPERPSRYHLRTRQPVNYSLY